MAFNQTIESPNFEKIDKEAGQFTADAVRLLWSALNETRADLRRDFGLASNKIAPKLRLVSAAASVDNLDLEGGSIVQFTGASGQNFTGMRAPETGESRIVFVLVTGAGTITAKHGVTSEAANRLSNESGGDVTLATGAGIIYIYLSSLWREVA